MARPTHIYIDEAALRHNVRVVRSIAAGKPIVAMVKANAYGGHVASIAPAMDGLIDYLGVSCSEEAHTIRRLGVQTACIVFHGVFSPDEFLWLSEHRCEVVLHHRDQIAWLLATPLAQALPVWLKVNTGMNRLGVALDEAQEFLDLLSRCPWVKNIGLMSHFACSDERNHPLNAKQLKAFQSIQHSAITRRSLANSAAVFSMPETHYDLLRLGIALYGVSPFADSTGRDLGLKPVMRFESEVMALHTVSQHESVGYGAVWNSSKNTGIAVIPVGYGDGYPRIVQANTPVSLAGYPVPIIGRVSMDTLCVDISAHPQAISLHNPVELWGKHIPLEHIARAASMSPYELLTKMTLRAYGFRV